VTIKPATSYDEQVTKLKERGCIIDDENFCIEILKRINYYRLTAYFLPFKTNGDKYLPGTNFNTVYQIYEFDRKLRSLLLSALEELEIYLRSGIAYLSAHEYGPLGYMDANNYNNHHNHKAFCEDISRQIHVHHEKPFVKHHLEKYQGQFPIWVIVELFSFGMLSKLYSHFTTSFQKKISTYLFHTTYSNVHSWLQCCTDLRNICAHYGRLYYELLPSIPAHLPGSIYKRSNRRLFATVYVLSRLYPDKDKWNLAVLVEFESLIEQYQPYIQMDYIGFPEDWPIILGK
jgi:abortive infection bacteriophage resistance protein